MLDMPVERASTRLQTQDFVEVATVDLVIGR
jgi:hypothetical protein